MTERPSPGVLHRWPDGKLTIPAEKGGRGKSMSDLVLIDMHNMGAIGGILGSEASKNSGRRPRAFTGG